MNKIAVVNHEDFGVEKTKAKEIEAAFTPMVEAMTALQPEFENCIALKAGDEQIELASELLKKYVKVRTGTAKAHKDQKAPFFQAGKFIDGLKNAQKEASDYYEGALKEIINYEAEIAKRQMEEVQEGRVAQIDPFVEDGYEHPSYSAMPYAVWESYLKTAQEVHRLMKDVPQGIKDIWNNARAMDLLAFQKWFDDKLETIEK